MLFWKFVAFILTTIGLTFFDSWLDHMSVNFAIRLLTELFIAACIAISISSMAIKAHNAMIGRYFRLNPEDKAPASQHELQLIDEGFRSIGRFYDSNAQITSSQAQEILAEIERQRRRNT